MAETGSHDALDLTGLWDGLYDYPHGYAPVAFCARITETHGWIVGSTEEVAGLPEYDGRTIAATLQGRRAGTHVTFLKLYDEALADYDSVAYEGTLNGEGTEISGRWMVPGSWSGTFLMTRPAAEQASAHRRTAAKV